MEFVDFRSDTLYSKSICLRSSLSPNGSIFLPLWKFSWPVFPDVQQKTTSIVPCLFLQSICGKVSWFRFGLRKTRVPREAESGPIWNLSGCQWFLLALGAAEDRSERSLLCCLPEPGCPEKVLVPGLFSWPPNACLFSQPHGQGLREVTRMKTLLSLALKCPDREEQFMWRTIAQLRVFPAPPHT